jgi:hypothetical protein
MRREKRRLDSFAETNQPELSQMKLLSTGQRLVGVGTIVQQDERVEIVNQKFSEIADILLEMQSNEELTNNFHQSMHNQAIMDIVKASMMSAKVLTFKFLN